MPIDDVRLQSVAGGARSLTGPLLAVALVAAATAFRVSLAPLLPQLTVFSLYYPAILASALVGGEFAAVVALGLSIGIGWGLLEGSPRISSAAVQVNVLIFALSGAFIAGVGAALRRTLRRRRADFLRLADREARYRALFEGVSEGFSLLEAYWENGEVVDFVVVEVNPALLKMFDLSPTIVGRRQSEYRGGLTTHYVDACRRAIRGESVRIENYAPPTRRWFDIRFSRVDENLIALIFVDITDHKAMESHRTEMFNELNHRVKNNLAAVSAMLSMQARAAEDPSVGEQLMKAVDRIEAIGEVHASLYRASSTGDVDFSAYLQRLCDRLAASLMDNERVTVKVETDPVTSALEEAVALGLIVNELVTNAAKHAYPPPARGVIHVTLRNRPGELVLAVCDHGCGLPDGERAPGIGMRLVRSLVQQCHGRLEVRNDDGAHFTIRLPEHAPQTESTQSRLL